MIQSPPPKKERVINLIKVITNIIVIVLFIIGGYYYVTDKIEMKRAFNFEKPTQLLDLYYNKTGEYCVCSPNLDDIMVLNK